MIKNELLINVEKALDEIRPYLIADGGNISLVAIENNIVKIQFSGTCIDCQINHLTLKNGVEATIKRFAPQITEVIEVK